MEWYIILVLVLGIPAILLPIAFVLYLNVSGTYQVIRGARERQKRRAEVLREAHAILEGKVNAMAEIGVATEEDRITTFWKDKSPCWDMCRCPTQIREECPAYTNRLLPCWEIEGTYGKLAMEGGRANGQNTTVCQTCRVYKKYGARQPIRHRLVGAGIDTYLNSP